MQPDVEQIAQAFVDFSLLEWYLDAGVNELHVDAPINRMAMPSVATMMAQEMQPSVESIGISAKQKMAAPSSLAASPSAASAQARNLADNAKSLDELYASLLAFDGCALKRTATHTVVGEGCAQPEIVFISDTPRDAEDRNGTPFAGDADAIVRRLCQGAGVDWEQCYRLPCVFWRPPGNRAVSADELAICLPFVEKAIALLAPKRIVLCGATPVKSLLKIENALSRVRGGMHAYTNVYCDQNSYQTVITYHPYAVVGDATKKKHLWQDFLKISHHVAMN